MPDIRGPSIKRLWVVRDTFITLGALSILDFEPPLPGFLDAGNRQKTRGCGAIPAGGLPLVS
jgi:hypothetical protein